ncbi:MAG: MSHA biogenesis protein MshK [Betaproteobacteria bacterium HGW-Betaproteobacteria-14]|nr:MAG: MSHA biogenesis protein MshK [Betaproteobacteria bacterium HGW-Betaproteobacteria-14]
MLAALPGAVMAQGMKDPTRPPPQFLDPADVAQAAMPPDSGLQSIKRTGKRYLALLNGEWVKPGDRAGEAVVVKIAEQSVVLSYPDGRRETIGMYPDIELRPKEVQSRPRKAVGRTVGK